MSMRKLTPSRLPNGINQASAAPPRINGLVYTHSRNGKVLTRRNIAATGGQRSVVAMASDTTASDYPGPAWPLLLAPIKLLAQPGDRGLGDIIARTIGPVGGEAYKGWYKTIFGRSCGCADRQATLNTRFPLS